MVIISSATNTHQRYHEKYTPTDIFIGGLGFVGSKLASKLHEVYPQAYISGTVRSIERRDGLLTSSSNIKQQCSVDNVHVLDIDNEYIGLDNNGLKDLINADTIIQTVAPIADFDTDPLLTFHGKQLSMNNELEKKKLKYVVYISSTGVYGNHNGNWVSEEEDENVLLCTNAKSLARIKAEEEWGKLEQQHNIHQEKEGDIENRTAIPTRVDYFRCGGIYGPGRGPLFSSTTH